MNNKPLFGLTVLAILLAAAAYFVAQKSEPGAPRQIGQKPFADRDFNAVTRIRVVGPNSTTTVVRTEAGWVLPEYHHYWADFDKIRSFIRTLADLKISDALRVDEAQKGELLLNAAGAPTGAGTQVSLDGPDDHPIVRLLVGSRPRSANASEDMGMFADSVAGRHVALDDGSPVLVDNPLSDLPNSDKEWMDPQFLAPPATELVRLSVSVPGRTPLLLSRDIPSEGWGLADLPAGETLDIEKVNRLTGALGFLHFTEVADPALTAEQTGLDHPARIDADTADGRRFSILFGRSEPLPATRYIRVEMGFKPPPPADPVSTTNTPAATPSPGDTEADRALRTEEVKQLNQRIGTWTYTLDDFTASLLLPSLDDLIQKPLPPPSVSEAPPQPAELQGDIP